MQVQLVEITYPNSHSHSKYEPIREDMRQRFSTGGPQTPKEPWRLSHESATALSFFDWWINVWIFFPSLVLQEMIGWFFRTKSMFHVESNQKAFEWRFLIWNTSLRYFFWRIVIPQPITIVAVSKKLGATTIKQEGHKSVQDWTLYCSRQLLLEVARAFELSRFSMMTDDVDKGRVGSYFGSTQSIIARQQQQQRRLWKTHS